MTGWITEGLISWRWPSSWWRHQRKRCPRFWPFVRGIHQWLVDSPRKGEWRRALVSSLICALTNVWVNNWDAGDLKRHNTHYEVPVMFANWIVGHIITCIIMHSAIKKLNRPGPTSAICAAGLSINVFVTEPLMGPTYISASLCRYHRGSPAIVVKISRTCIYCDQYVFSNNKFAGTQFWTWEE